MGLKGTAIIIVLLIFGWGPMRDKALTEYNTCYKVVLDKTLISNKTKYSDIFKDPVLVQLDTSGEYCFGEIQSLKIIRDTIYIFDRNQSRSFYMFSMNGRFIGKISRIGRGPGEYVAPVDFDVNENNGDVYILDCVSGKLITFGKSGSFKDEVKLSRRLVSFSYFGGEIYCLNSFPKSMEEQMIHCYTLKGLPVFSALEADHVTDGGLKFRYGNNFYKHNNSLRFFISERNIVYSLKNRTVSKFLELTISKDLLKNDKMKPFLYDYSENDKYAHFKTIIHNVPYDVFFNFETGEVFTIGLAAMDDLTKLPVKLLGIWENKMVGIVESQNIPYIRSLIDKHEINDPLVKTYVRGYKSDMLVLYDLK